MLTQTSVLLFSGLKFHNRNLPALYINEMIKSANSSVRDSFPKAACLCTMNNELGLNHHPLDSKAKFLAIAPHRCHLFSSLKLQNRNLPTLYIDEMIKSANSSV